ncbi:MAG TPA: hypothetical protein VM123_16765 [archaeon]|nr:hypothetical protein [archaeon]
MEKQETKNKVTQKEVPPGLLLRSARLVEKRPKEKGCYGFKGGIIAFVDWEGNLYITPGTRLKLELLQSSGFKNPRPQIQVPFSDNSVKSRRRLRNVLPKTEIMRSVQENQMPVVDGKVFAGILKVNREGLKSLDEEFLSQRCAKAEEKGYHYVGLCASYHAILSFTDWEANTYVTPYSDQKRTLLENHGYVYVKSMIKVPYSLENDENRAWLAAHIPHEEWARTEKEVSEERSEEKLSKAKKRIEELGLKDLPEDLLACSALCEESYPHYAGMLGSHSGILSFTNPMGATYVTPATKEKVELLKSLGYQFVGSSIKVPHSLKTEADIAWLRDHIAPEHWEAAKEANQAELRLQEQEQAEKRQRSLGLEELPSELIEHSIKTDAKQPNFVGQYFVRNEILGFVDLFGTVFITPVTQKKKELLQEANYKKAHIGFSLPYSDGTEEDLEFIRQHLSQEEFDLSRKELEEETEKTRQKTIEKIISTLDLKEIPENLMARSAKTEFQDLELIGSYSSRGGIACFVYQDGFFYITPKVPWKEEALREAGYGAPQRLFRVPYSSETGEDREWLEQNLPSGELEKSRRELEELEKEEKEKDLKSKLKRLGIGDEVPEELAARSAVTPEVDTEQIGRYIEQGEFLGFVGPDGQIWITPNTPHKLEILRKANYDHATRRFVLPFSSDSEEDQGWRLENLPEGELKKSQEELEQLKRQKEDHMAAEILQKRSIGKLAPEFLERCLRTEQVSAQNVGFYLERENMLFFINSERYLCITPSTPNKLKTLAKAGYTQHDRLLSLPYCSGSEEDLAWIKANLPEGELERSLKELEELKQAKSGELIEKNMEKFSLKPVPEQIFERSADSGTRDPNNIGRLGLFRGVMAFVNPDERVFVTWYTPDKQETLEGCGYKMEGRLPIKVPYAMQDPSQRSWLMENLPGPDDEENISVDENK